MYVCMYTHKPETIDHLKANIWHYWDTNPYTRKSALKLVLLGRPRRSYEWYIIRYINHWSLQSFSQDYWPSLWSRRSLVGSSPRPDIKTKYKKYFFGRILSRFLAKTLRVNNIAMKKFLKKKTVFIYLYFSI